LASKNVCGQEALRLWWRQGTSVYNTTANSAVDYDQFGMELNFSRSLIQKLSMACQFVQESSGQANVNDTVNIVDLSFICQS